MEIRLVKKMFGKNNTTANLNNYRLQEIYIFLYKKDELEFKTTNLIHACNLTIRGKTNKKNVTLVCMHE